MKYFKKFLFLTVVSSSLTTALLWASEPAPTIKALIAGGTRNVGYHLAKKLTAQNCPVTLLVWDAQKAKELFNENPLVTIVQGAVEKDPALVSQLAQGKTHLFNCAHFPFKEWEAGMTAAAQNLLSAAKTHNATLVFPSRFYSVGKTDHPVKESEATAACSEQGKLFETIENQLKEAGEKGECATLVVRCAHTFGPQVVDGLMERLFKNAVEKKPMAWVYQTNIPYQVAYTPDVAAAIIALCQERSQGHHIFNFAGTTLTSLNDWCNQIATAAGYTPWQIELDSWWKVSSMALFQTDAYACKDIFYTFEAPVLLDENALKAAFPSLSRTPMATAINETLAWYKGNIKT